MITLVNRALVVWRPSTDDDGTGGQEVTFTEVGPVRARVSQATAQELQVAQQFGARHTHAVHLLDDADVRRGDELRGDGQVFRVLSTVVPSEAVYLRANVELTQTEGE